MGITGASAWQSNLKEVVMVEGCGGLHLPPHISPLSPQVTFKKTKRRVKKIRKKEKEVVVRADDLLPLGDQTQDGDFGSR